MSDRNDLPVTPTTLKLGSWKVTVTGFPTVGVRPFQYTGVETSSVTWARKERSEEPTILFVDALLQWYDEEYHGAMSFLDGALRCAPKRLRSWWKGVACHPYASRLNRNHALRTVAHHLGVSPAHAADTRNSKNGLVNIACAAGYQPRVLRPIRHCEFPELVEGWEVVEE